ncbi:DUF6477 family protein [Parasulfitobacter algicola]|uniref:Uncharacterized protein n=1 Tax=Parasulfitobacter algicola TaxID=2614809 RepID=A0ABX2IYZ7_9RHOB|nr:DUF6477 family protein [Sulfitobacter algicola]NSX55798.1 hypothetical protein [Sulfitobacter algicola]
MTDLLTLLETLRRPSLLITAAQHGVSYYIREKTLGRLLKSDTRISHGAAIAKLMAIEADMNARRKDKNAAYSCVCHVEVLIAMLAEANFLRANCR